MGGGGVFILYLYRFFWLFYFFFPLPPPCPCFLLPFPRFRQIFFLMWGEKSHFENKMFDNQISIFKIYIWKRGLAENFCTVTLCSVHPPSTHILGAWWEINNLRALRSPICNAIGPVPNHISDRTCQGSLETFVTCIKFKSREIRAPKNTKILLFLERNTPV